MNSENSSEGLLQKSLSQLTSQKKKLHNSFACPLDDPKIGVITESDHRNGLCLCPLCNCGKHTCPNQAGIEPYPKSTFTTQYQSNFKGNQCTPPLKLVPQNRHAPSHFLDLQTTNSSTYKPSTVKPSTSVPSIRPGKPPSASFNGRTSYGSNFPNWGSNGCYIVKHKYSKHTNSLMPMETRTSYSENFQKMSQEDLHAPKVFSDQLKRFRATVGLKTPNVPLSGDTTVKKEFRDYTKQNLTKRASIPSGSILQAQVTRHHYKSTYGKDFVPSGMELNHRSLRKTLNRIGVSGHVK